MTQSSCLVWRLTQLSPWTSTSPRLSAAATITYGHCGTSDRCWRPTSPRCWHTALSHLGWTMSTHCWVQPRQIAGGTEFTCQSCMSGIAFCQRHRITTAAPLVAYSTADWLQAGSHHLPHTINRHTSLPDRPHQKLPPSCTLWSADKLLLSVPRMILALLAKAFNVSASSVWNSLSYNCRSAESFSSFRHALKTELFDTAYSERKHSA